MKRFLKVDKVNQNFTTFINALHHKKNLPIILTLGIFILVCVFTILSVNIVQNRISSSLFAQQTINDGRGGWCNPTINKGCGGDNGCDHWEVCNENYTCIDTTAGGTKPASANACGDKAISFTPIQVTPTPQNQMAPTSNPQQAQVSQDLVNDGQGGWCNLAINKGCGGNNGCRRWEYCNENHTCIDTTEGGTRPASARACGIKVDYVPTLESTPTTTAVVSPISTVTPTSIAIPTSTIPSDVAADLLDIEGMNCFVNNIPYPHGYCSPTSAGKPYFFCNNKKNLTASSQNYVGWIADSTKTVCIEGKNVCIGNGAKPSGGFQCCSENVDENGRCSISNQSQLPEISPSDIIIITQTPTVTPTSTPTFIPVNTPTSTFTPSPIQLQTSTPTLKPTDFIPTATMTMPTATYTPSPTNTHTPIPTATSTQIPEPTHTSAPTLTTTSIPVPTNTIAIVQDQCSNYGLDLYNPQMRLLVGRELCSDGRVVPSFGRSVPNDLIDLAAYFRSQNTTYFGSRNIRLNNEAAEGLRLVYEYMKNSDSNCIPYIAYGYRSYEQQEEIYNDYQCEWDPVAQTSYKSGTAQWCGVAQPGWSVHQAGLAVDLRCAIFISNDQGDSEININWQEKFIDNIPLDKLFELGFIHPIPKDDPHFHYYK